MHTYPRTYQHMHAGTAVFVAHTLFQAPAAHLSVDHCALFFGEKKKKRQFASPEGRRVCDKCHTARSGP